LPEKAINPEIKERITKIKKVVIYYKSSAYMKSMRRDEGAQRAGGNKGGTTIRAFNICIIKASELKSTLVAFSLPYFATYCKDPLFSINE